MAGKKEALIYADPHGDCAPRPRSRRLAAALGTGAAALALMILVAAVLGVTIQGKGERYQAALALLEDKQYADAAAELDALDGFRDSEHLLAQLENQSGAYAQALILVEEGYYDEALTAFQSLADYADSLQWASWGVTYRRCTDEMARLTAARQADAQAWSDLAAALESLGDVENAPALAAECRRMAVTIAE